MPRHSGGHGTMPILCLPGPHRPLPRSRGRGRGLAKLAGRQRSRAAVSRPRPPARRLLPQRPPSLRKRPITEPGSTASSQDSRTPAQSRISRDPNGLRQAARTCVLWWLPAGSSERREGNFCREAGRQGSSRNRTQSGFPS